MGIDINNHQLLHEGAAFMTIFKDILDELRKIRKQGERDEQRQKDKQRRL